MCNIMRGLPGTAREKVRVCRSCFRIHAVRREIIQLDPPCTRQSPESPTFCARKSQAPDSRRLRIIDGREQLQDGSAAHGVGTRTGRACKPSSVPYAHCRLARWTGRSEVVVVKGINCDVVYLSCDDSVARGQEARNRIYHNDEMSLDFDG